jgi:outer membrane protein assembly factor BamB
MLAGASSVTAALWLSPSAPAQLPPILPPPPGAGGPSHNVTSPGGESLAYGANPSRTGSASEPSLFGPLEKAWSRNLRGSVNQPLIAGDRVLISVGHSSSSSYGSDLLALNPRTGKEIWRQPTPGTYYSAPIAADTGVVVSINYDGELRAFAVDDGRPLWTQTLSGTPRVRAPPVAADGTVYAVATDGGNSIAQVSAFSIADGMPRWTRSTGIDTGAPALDNERVFVTDDCGDAVAVRRADGMIAWSRDTGSSTGCFEADVAVFDGRVYAGGGYVYDAVTGAERSRLPAKPDVFTAGLGMVTLGESLDAVSLAAGTVEWHVRSSGASLHPLAVPGTIYSADFGRVRSLEPSSGRVLWASKLRTPGFFEGGMHRGLAAGAGRLFVADTEGVVAYRSVFEPGARGASVGATAFDVIAGSRVGIGGGVGYELRASKPRVNLEADRFPFKRGHTIAKRISFDDGSSFFRAPVRANTRFRISVPDGPVSPGIVVYAYPRFSFHFRALSPRYALAKIGIHRMAIGAVRGRRLHLYLNRAHSNRFRRLGSARVKRSGNDAEAGVRFRRLKKLGRNDLFHVCVEGLARNGGYGRNVGLERHCGQKRIRLHNGKRTLAASATSVRTSGPGVLDAITRRDQPPHP